LYIRIVHIPEYSVSLGYSGLLLKTRNGVYKDKVIIGHVFDMKFDLPTSMLV